MTSAELYVQVKLTLSITSVDTSYDRVTPYTMVRNRWTGPPRESSVFGRFYGN